MKKDIFSVCFFSLLAWAVYAANPSVVVKIKDSKDFVVDVDKVSEITFVDNENPKDDENSKDDESSKEDLNPSLDENLEYRTFNVNDAEFRMVKVEGGTFLMGAQYYRFEEDNYDVFAMENELPVHSVKLSDYYIAEFEFTSGLARKLGCSYGAGSEKKMPIRNITRTEALKLIDILNQYMHDNGQLAANEYFTFPTEAQWEYAAKGGKYSKGTIYAGDNDYNKVCYCRENSNKVSFTSVGSFASNELGLYDMSGNVLEFCLDPWGDYTETSQVDPQAPGIVAGDGRYVIRGGSFYTVAKRCRVTHRHNISSSESYNSLGIRLCLVTDKK